MKNFKKIFVLTMVCILTILACTKEIDIIFSFPFNLETEYENSATINYQEKIVITIAPELIVSDNVYEFMYKIIQGEGHFVGADDGIIPEDTWIVSDGLTLNFDFLGTLIGTVEIEFAVRDQEGETETIILLYEVIHNPFIWEVTTTVSELTINKTSPFSMALSNIGKDKSVTYESRIYFAEGDGELNIIDGSGNETEIILDVLTPIEENVYSCNIILNTTGNHKIIFEVTDSNGQVKVDSLVYLVREVDFTFAGSPQNNTLYSGEKTNLNFLIQELFGGNDVYESRFVFNSGNASITRTVSGFPQNIVPGNLYPVTLDPYYWEFLATEEGIIDMTFYAINASGVEREVNIIMEVINGTFDFNAFETEDSALVNDAVVITFDINESGLSGLPYTVVYDSTLDGFITYNGVDYSPGEDIIISTLNFSATYTGLEFGGHVITFDATNSFGETKTDGVAIVFEEDNFAFSATTENGNVILNETTDFNFIVAGVDPASTFQIYYTVTGTGTGVLTSGGITYAPGVNYDIVNGGTTWEFEGTGLGDLTYTFYVVSNSGKEQSDVININVNAPPEPDFTFSSIAESNSQLVGGDIYMNLSIIETTVPNVASYSMTFTTTGTGTVSYLGVIYNPGDVISVSPVNFTVSYQGLSVGTHDVEFTVSNDNVIPIQKSDSVSVSFENIDFSINASGGENMFVNETESFNVSVTQSQLDASISYNVVYTLAAGSTGTGTITSSTGAVINLGQSYPIILGNTEMNFIAETLGIVNIDVTVTDSYGQTQSDIVTYQISNIDFILNTSDGANMFVNETESFNVSVTQSQLDASISYNVVYTLVGGSTGSGRITTSSGAVVNLGQSYPINIGNTEMNLIAETLGTLNIEVTVTDSFGQVQTDIISYQINNIDFNLSTSGGGSPMYIATTEDFNVFLTQLQLDPLINYNVVYSLAGSVGSGTIMTSTGFAITLGQSYPINLGNTEMVFTADTPGNVFIDVTVTDSNGIFYSSTVTYTVNEIEYQFTGVSQDTNVMVGEFTNLNFLIAEASPTGTSYQMMYEITGGAGATIIRQGGIIRNPLSWENVTTGAYTWEFEGTGVGPVTITFTARNTVTGLESPPIVITVTVDP